MIAKVKKTIKDYGMIARGDRVVVAVSGGPDSMALCRVLECLARDDDLKLIVAHLNHGLRPEAAADARLVQGMAQSGGWPFELAEVDIAGLHPQSGRSLEDTAREVRYAFLDRVAARHGAEKIALGHHRRDQAETVLMNLMRGSGPDGLKGMLPVRNGRYIRPLLFLSRQEILTFLAKQAIPFSRDLTNDDVIFSRNRIRHQLMPLLRKDYNPNIDAALGHMAEILRKENDFLEAMVDETLSGWGVHPSHAGVALSVQALCRLHEALQCRLIKRLLEALSPETKGIAYAHIMAVKGILASGRPAATLNLPFRIGVSRDYDHLIIARRDRFLPGRGADETAVDYAYTVDIPGEVYIVETGARIRLTLGARDLWDMGALPDKSAVAYIDFDRLQLPLTIRNVRPGDRIRPLGMTGTKKIKSLFIDKKISRGRRRQIPLLADSQSVVWIGGWCIDARVSVGAHTVRILRAEIV